MVQKHWSSQCVGSEDHVIGKVIDKHCGLFAWELTRAGREHTDRHSGEPREYMICGHECWVSRNLHVT